MSLFATGIRPAIDAQLKAKSEEKREYGDYWSASSAGYCMRLNMMRRLGVPRVPEIQEDLARTTRVFESGHIFHEWLQRITKDSGLSIAQEVELQDEDLMIRGHFDDLVLIQLDERGEPLTLGSEPRGSHLILYDYKTAHSRSFHYSKGRPMSHYHRMQLGTYMYMLRKVWHSFTPTIGDHVRGTELTEARILRISKDDLVMEEKQLLWSPELEKEVVGYWRTLNGYLKSGKLPACTCLDYESGFMGRRSKQGKIYNDYFYHDEPCSQEWFNKFKEGLTNGRQTQLAGNNVE